MLISTFYRLKFNVAQLFAMLMMPSYYHVVMSRVIMAFCVNVLVPRWGTTRSMPNVVRCVHHHISGWHLYPGSRTRVAISLRKSLHMSAVIGRGRETAGRGGELGAQTWWRQPSHLSSFVRDLQRRLVRAARNHVPNFTARAPRCSHRSRRIYELFRLTDIPRFALPSSRCF